MAGIRPLHEKVLVLLDPIPVTSAGGLYLPDDATERPRNRPDSREGVVVKVGPGRLDKKGRRVAPGVQHGDRVLVNAWLTDPVRPTDSVGKDRLQIVAEEDILAIIEQQEG